MVNKNWSFGIKFIKEIELWLVPGLVYSLQQYTDLLERI